MPIAELQLPDGRIAELEVPEGTSEADILAFAEQNFKPQQEVPKGQYEKYKQEHPTGPDLLSALNPFNQDATLKDYGAGRVEAVKQLADPELWKSIGHDINPANFPPIPGKGSGIPAEQVDQMTRESMNQVLAFMPTTRMSGAARQLLKPSATGAEAVKQATLDLAGNVGYSVPRSNIKQTTLTNLGERFGGKQAIEATAQIKNQPITNKLAAKALGLADDAPITPEVLSGIREQAGKAYEAVKQVGTVKADGKYVSALDDIKNSFSGASKDFPELASESVKKLSEALNKKSMSADGVIEQIKNLRGSAKANQSSSVASERLLGKAQKKAADALDDLLERNISATMPRQLVADYRNARQLIAKTYSVEKALNPGTGNVSAAQLAKQAAKGVPLSNELKQAATFAQAFPRLAREPIGAPASGGALEPLVYGTAGAIGSGGVGTLAAGVPIIGKPIARHLMTTVPKVGPVTSMFDSPIAQRMILGAGLSINNKRSMRDR